MYFYIQENIRGQKKVFLPFIPTGRRKREQSQLVLTVPGPGYNWWQEDRHIARGDRQTDTEGGDGFSRFCVSPTAWISWFGSRQPNCLDKKIYYF